MSCGPATTTSNSLVLLLPRVSMMNEFTCPVRHWYRPDPWANISLPK